MELRAFAEQVLLTPDLSRKVARISESLTDENPGEPQRVERPARPANLLFAARRTAPAMPKAQSLRDPVKRAIAHHVMANHELQALEVMAMVLLAFPEAPAEFRMGMAKIMFDEQRHTRMHAQRCDELGLAFGELPVNSWIWQKAQDFQTTLEYVAGLPLVFEGANLDHTVEFEDYFRQAGDRRSAAIMRAIHKDEIHHVEFGLRWLRRFKSPDDSDWDAWRKALKWPIRPEKARGDLFQREARLQAGLTPDFVDRLEHCPGSETE
ncbi:MAG: ferritin-like domain-containing protein [Planctomycetota bacterium]